MVQSLEKFNGKICEFILQFYTKILAENVAVKYKSVINIVGIFFFFLHIYDKVSKE